MDKDKDGKIRTLIELVREHAPERLRGKGKGKEVLTRYGGEVVEGEPASLPRDPRKDKRPNAPRPVKPDFVPLKYEVRLSSFFA